MNMQTKRQPSLIEQAQRWELMLMQGDPAEQAAFVAWIKRSPAHLEAYLLHLAADRELRQLDRMGEFDIDDCLAKASTNVIELTSRMPQMDAELLPATGRPKGWRASGVAAIKIASVCLILAGIFLGTWSRLQSSDYVTNTGEQRRIILTDGSIVELNTRSHIRVSFSQTSREVDLLSGEALFSVQHDATRPFRVRVADKMIEDIGTQFSVYLRPDASTIVSVLDGSVQILPAKSDVDSHGVGARPNNIGLKSAPSPKPTRLSAGEAVSIASSGGLIKRAINVADAAAWREHRLLFEGATLLEVATEFNRYNKRQLHVGSDPILLNKRYTATFDAYDPESFVEALQDDPTLSIQTSDNITVIQIR